MIDHKLYWGAVETPDEARYLTAILNSQALTNAVLPLQARGQHNPRDFDTHIFALPFPAFDSSDALHLELADLAAHAETLAADVELEPQWQFQKCRRVLREALVDAGIAGTIDATVDQLLGAGKGPS